MKCCEVEVHLYFRLPSDAVIQNNFERAGKRLSGCWWTRMVAVGIERETLLLQIEAQLQALVSFCPLEARMQFSSIKNLQSKRDLRAKLPH